MPIFGLTDELSFPSPELADESGILAVGGDLKPERLLLAYHEGIFPWPHEGMPLLWFSPPTRFVLAPKEIHLSRSLRKAMRKNPFRIAFDTDFQGVMKGCQSTYRPDQDGTWITDEIIEGYSQLHRLGFAHSIESYEGDSLVGGLYGVSIGSTFFGESMFATKPEASKVAFATLAAHLIEWEFSLIDCQTQTHHLESFGAHGIDRKDFIAGIHESRRKKTRRGRWECVMTPSKALDKIASVI